MEKIQVAQPFLGGNERKYVLDCLDSNWISSTGKYLDLFESSFAEFCRTKFAISTNNGTTALHLAVQAMGVEPGDEVLVPAVTYVATANAVKYCGATPVFVDVLEGSLNLDPEQMEAKISTRTKGVIAVHLYGDPAPMDKIIEVARRHNLWVIEDAAEAHGAEYRGRRVGGLADCATFSFFGNKIITTGEGGMITTNNPDLAKKIKQLRGQGMDPERRYWFPVIGYNYRMTNIQAALGLAQLEQIEKALAFRRDLAGWYSEDFAGVDQLLLPQEQLGSQHAYWMYTVFLRDGNQEKRDQIMQFLESSGIETRPVFYPLHILPPYFKGEIFRVADSWAMRGINLPTHQNLTRSHVRKISDAVKAGLALI